MKRLLLTWMILAIACPLTADTVLLQETFEGPAGKSVNGWNGWTGDPGIVISNMVIDQGNSITWTGDVEWPAVSKRFQHTPAAGEQYILTATLNAPDAKGAYADVRLAVGDGNKARHVGAQFGYRNLYFEQDNSVDGITICIDQTAITMDVRLVVTDEQIECFHRNHGETAWTNAGRMKATNRVSSYNTVTIVGGVVPGRSVGGGVDNLDLVVQKASSKAEPSSQAK
jgi:hypothetical protein